MNQHGETTAKAQARIHDLTTHLDTYVRKYEQLSYEQAPFTGPDLHFHLRTLERLRELGSPENVIADDCYFEYLYATLTAWGLHRAGKRGPKLADYDGFRRSAADLFQSLSRSPFVDRTVLSLSSQEAEQAAEELGEAIARHQGIGLTSKTLVVNSKAVHHFLPDLCPPIDRRYVLSFFFGTEGYSRDVQEQRRLFGEVFRAYHDIASYGDNPQIIRNAISRAQTGTGMVTWHSSQTKVLDNAVIAYKLSREQKRSK